MQPWARVGAPLEYWFFRTAWPGGALLVDLIERRVAGTLEVRVASAGGGTGRVDRVVVPLDAHRGPGDEVAGCTLTPMRSAGSVGAVSWDLSFERGPLSLTAPPDPAHRLRATDLALVSWPDVASSGRVVIDGLAHDLVHASGMACHYWGRRLPDRWLWLSASDFDRPGLHVEASVLTSRLWGGPLSPPGLGYAFLGDGSESRFVASPLTGLVRRFLTPTGTVAVTVRGLRRGWTVTAKAPSNSFVDLGEGIVQSLQADCSVRDRTGITKAEGTACLELRDLDGADAALASAGLR